MVSHAVKLYWSYKQNKFLDRAPFWELKINIESREYRQKNLAGYRHILTITSHAICKHGTKNAVNSASFTKLHLDEFQYFRKLNIKKFKSI